MDWKDIKKRGSTHYKWAGGIEVIDLLKGKIPNQSLCILQIKALSDIIKYAFRMLMTGINSSDIEKIKHYADIACVTQEDRRGNGDKGSTT